MLIVLSKNALACLLQSLVLTFGSLFPSLQEDQLDSAQQTSLQLSRDSTGLAQRCQQLEQVNDRMEGSIAARMLVRNARYGPLAWRLLGNNGKEKNRTFSITFHLNLLLLYSMSILIEVKSNKP